MGWLNSQQDSPKKRWTPREILIPCSLAIFSAPWNPQSSGETSPPKKKTTKLSWDFQSTFEFHIPSPKTLSFFQSWFQKSLFKNTILAWSKNFHVEFASFHIPPFSSQMMEENMLPSHPGLRWSLVDLGLHLRYLHASMMNIAAKSLNHKGIYPKNMPHNNEYEKTWPKSEVPTYGML